MPYSRSKQKRIDRQGKWPDLRYSPSGEVKLFYSAEEVPDGWTTKAQIEYKSLPTVVLNKEELIEELINRGIEIDPTWGNAQLKKVLDNDISSTR